MNPKNGRIKSRVIDKKGFFGNNSLPKSFIRNRFATHLFKILYSNALGISDSEFLVPKRWVRLLFEPDTGITSIKDCVSANDVTGDGDYKLVIADFAETQCRLKLLKGLNFITDAHLPDEPAGV